MPHLLYNVFFCLVYFYGFRRTVSSVKVLEMVLHLSHFEPHFYKVTLVAII